MKKMRQCAAFLLLLSALNPQFSSAFAQGTAFTYEGRLNSSGSPVNGLYDFRFRLDADPAGNTILDTLLTNAIPVTNGLFITTIDFGAGWFTGSNYWLEVDVKTNSFPTYTALNPFQLITPTPYAVMANSASNLLGTLSAGQLNGAVSSANLTGTYSNAVTLSNAGNSFAGAFAGDGSSLSNLNASQLSSGTIPVAQLPGFQPPNYASIGGGQGNMIASGTWTTIGGGESNVITAGSGAVISGGINNTNNNGIYSFLGGGVNNYNNGGDSVLVGGIGNRNNGPWSFLGGGQGNYNVNDGGASVLVGGINNTNYDGTLVGGADNLIAGTAAAFLGGGEYNQVNGTDAALVGGRNNYSGGNEAALVGGLGNVIHDSPYSFLGGGYDNYVAANIFGRSVIVGGESNLVSIAGNYSFIGGGFSNLVTGGYDFIGGGEFNSVTLTAYGSTISGGTNNNVSGIMVTIGGGGGNQATAHYGFIGGGQFNAISGGMWATIAGGQYNSVIGGDQTTVGGGFGNIVNAYYGTIAGGQQNTNNSQGGSIAGGQFNLASGQYQSSVGGGYENTASGNYSTVPGGFQNVASGVDSFAAGANAHATDNNSFAWGDGSRQSLSQGTNSFSVLATGGFWIFSGAYPAGVKLTTGSSAWATISDRNAKKNFAPVDTKAVLEKLAAVPMQQWNYKWEKDGDVPNIGPMAQDFKAAFYPGRDDKSITTLEFDGVELAAIQGLNQKVNEKDVRIQEQASEIAELKQSVAELKQLVQSLAARN